MMKIVTLELTYIVRPGLVGDCEIVCTEFVKCVNKL